MTAVWLLRPLLPLICAFSIVLAKTVTVESRGVTFLGIQDEHAALNNFLGIRYAEAPVGNLRWRPPVPVRYDDESGAGVHINATTYGPGCINGVPVWSALWEKYNDNSTARARSDEEEEVFEDEDCLVLNVQTPMRPQSQRLPVMVYIHGGGFTGGSAFPTNGDSLVAQANGSIIHVALQYRLGPLGFLSGDEVKSDGTANAGLLDQRAAMRWVRDTIHIFGGDPNRITISGSSAGGGSVVMQMVMFGGSEEAPFHAAILDFPWWAPMYGRQWQENQYRTFSEAAGCSSLSCLRELPTSGIVSAMWSSFRTAYLNKQYGYGTFYWGPTVDGRVIVRHPIRDFRDGKFTKIPVLTTRAYDEGYSFVNNSIASEAEAVADLAKLFQEGDGFFAKTSMLLYPSTRYNTSHLKSLNKSGGAKIVETAGHPLSDAFIRMSAVFGDATINCPTSHAAKHVSGYGQPAWRLVFKAGYEFHGSPLPYFYSESPNADGGQWVGGIRFRGNATLADLLRSYWISFAVHQNPNVAQYSRIRAPSWPEFDPVDPQVLWVEPTSVQTRSDPDNSGNCQFFNDCRGNRCGLVGEW